MFTKLQLQYILLYVYVNNGLVFFVFQQKIFSNSTNTPGIHKAIFFERIYTSSLSLFFCYFSLSLFFWENISIWFRQGASSFDAFIGRVSRLTFRRIARCYEITRSHESDVPMILDRRVVLSSSASNDSWIYVEALRERMNRTYVDSFDPSSKWRCSCYCYETAQESVGHRDFNAFQDSLSFDERLWSSSILYLSHSLYFWLTNASAYNHGNRVSASSPRILRQMKPFSSLSLSLLPIRFPRLFFDTKQTCSTHGRPRVLFRF